MSEPKYLAILGDVVSTDNESLLHFLEQAHHAYNQLEQAIAPIDAMIADLSQDWDIRPLSFWEPVQKIHVPAIRTTSQACLSLFDRNRSRLDVLDPIPVPIIISALLYGYRLPLRIVGHEAEETAMVFAVFLQSPAVSLSGQMRQRQHLKLTIERLSKVVHLAVDEGRAKLVEAPARQAMLLAPSAYEEGDCDE